ncbi:5'-3' exonuclease [Virgibacillus sp. LDC1]|jgi:5'-3' exonuclease|uniref:5'-3' exonuclease n=1 Tax=Paenibacillus TaxID=44249 RepID=UPI000CC0FC1E|nr:MULTISPECIES: 5'-3' exonuclease H3TH domain-containing protein [Paenibacillus]MCV4233102.1 5'-3' exonuclease [Virgibacillus sp. LDC1]MBU5344952.1 5'-3' exonuclease [Paenibacillus lautus]MBX4146543.1 5'-3' exonuclease [Paenibacillus lautus]MEC0205399.1 5'-3' exonuclease H3TH domain-containing protein [Paenibacillus lautus]MEC0305245.1 5'-3' exonuclease H3TH domain-containing protein [Paenibacillus lautus]
MTVIPNQQPSLMLVDGMALLFRAYYATASSGYIRRTKAGVPTNAIYGFLRYMWDAIDKFQPTHVACCWDMGSKTFRTEQFASYKGNRPEAPDDLVPQFSLVRDVTECLGIPNLGVVGYEADDCIGTLARRYGDSMNVMILSGDHDLLQLVNDSTSVIIMKKGHGNYMHYTPETLYAEKGLSPRQVIDVKGLMGDTSDNYPGVRGIGEKTAVKLIQEYESVEGILANLDSLTKGVRTKIEADLEMLHLSRALAEIHCEVPMECELDLCRLSVDHERALTKLEELEMKSLGHLFGVAVVS